MVGRLEVLRGQFDLTWALAEYHLAQVSTASLLWEPVPSCWMVRPDATAFWRPDWQVPEPGPVPPPTAAWITWHWGWWWTVATAHLDGSTTPDREEIGWPGDAAGTVAREAAGRRPTAGVGALVVVRPTTSSLSSLTIGSSAPM